MSKRKKSLAKKNELKLSVEELLNRANTAMSTMQLESAEKLYSRALSIAPDDTNIMDALSDVLIQLGESDNALQLLLKSTSLAPEENPYKWMFLGQLQTGYDAIDSYKSGIRILEQLSDNDTTNDNKVLKKQLAKAHCSIAEIFLTDLCFDECAELFCEKEVQLALAVDEDNLDGLQTLSSLRLSQNRQTEAGEIIVKVYDRIVQIREIVNSRTVVDELQCTEQQSNLPDIPEFEFCIATAKLLIECSSSVDSSFAKKAMDLLDSLLDDDDDNVELWYLMGVASLSCNPPDFDSAREHLSRAQEMMNQIYEDCSANREPFLFEEQRELIISHLNMLNDVNNQQPMAADVEDGQQQAAAMDPDSEWSSCDEGED